MRIGDEIGHEWLTSRLWHRRFGLVKAEGLSPEVERIYEFAPHTHVLYFTSKQAAAGAFAIYREMDGMDEPIFPIRESVNYIEGDATTPAFVVAHHPQGVGGPHYLLEVDGRPEPVVAAHDEVYLWRTPCEVGRPAA